MVHPLLSPHLHPKCKEIILRFQACHRDHPYAKFWGACNQMRAELDQCLGDEYMERYEQKKEDTKEFRKRQAATLKKMDQDRADVLSAMASEASSSS